MNYVKMIQPRQQQIFYLLYLNGDDLPQLYSTSQLNNVAPLPLKTLYKLDYYDDASNVTTTTTTLISHYSKKMEWLATDKQALEYNDNCSYNTIRSIILTETTTAIALAATNE